jgi:hypothetical protein
MLYINSIDLIPNSIARGRTISIPFAIAAHANIAKRAIQVDRELNAHLIERKMEVEGSVLKV